MAVGKEEFILPLDFESGKPIFGKDPRDGYAARGFTQLGEPRRVGVTVSVDLP